MTTAPSHLPYFPATAPAVFTGPPAGAMELLEPVLADLAVVVRRPSAAEARLPTPCDRFDVTALRDHVLGWVQFFAAALADPRCERPRPDPDAYRAGQDDRDPADVVRVAAASIAAAVRDGAGGGEVVLASSRMDGGAVLAMILGEYLLHGWDLARALDLPWSPAPDACEAALDFFRAMIAPEYRGGDAGSFGPEVPVAAGAGAFERLLGFAGRDLRWSAGR